MMQVTESSIPCVLGGHNALWQQTRRHSRLQRGQNKLCTAQRQARRDAMQDRQRNKAEKLRVLRLISACVESNVGFAVAVVAEIVTPQQGLFGAWQGQDASLFAATALLLVSASAVLATMSKRRLGLQFKEAVITSMTALSRSRGSITNRTVDSAVDYVFDVVFDKDMVFRDLIQDEFL